MRTNPFIVGLILLASCSGGHDSAEVSLAREDSFTGRGNQNETLLTMTVSPSGDCTVKTVSVSLNAEASDVTAVSLSRDGKVLDSKPVKSGKNEYSLKCGESLDSAAVFTIGADIAPDAREGGKVSAEVLSVNMRGGAVTPEAPEAADREILLCRKRLFAPGDYGSQFWRIPAIKQLRSGVLLVVNDRRNTTEADLPNEIDVVSRYSTDFGQTWSEPVYVAKNQGKMAGYGDPSLVELEDGTVICMFAGAQGISGSSWEDPQRSYYSVSHDQGQTWSDPVDITASVWGPNSANPSCKKYKSSFFSSGNSLLLTEGEHKGRIMVANVASYDTGSGRSLNNHAVYSDDGGQTWKVSGMAYPNGDEAKIVQLNDGRILMSIRQTGQRAYAISEDDGQTWSETGFWPDINVTNCNGDLIRYDENTLLHTVPNSMMRENVSVFLSFDEGKTWPEHKTICAGPSQYSSITVLSDGTIGAYIEENPKSKGERWPHGTELWYERFSFEWLRDNQK